MPPIITPFMPSTSTGPIPASSPLAKLRRPMETLFIT